MKLLKSLGAAALGALVFALFWYFGFHAPYVTLWQMCLVGAVLGLAVRGLILMPPLRGYTHEEIMADMRRNSPCPDCSGPIKVRNKAYPDRCIGCGGYLLDDEQS